MEARHRSFGEFYPYYRAEHSNRTGRRRHFAGASTGLLLLAAALGTGAWRLVPAAVAAGDLYAWIGHFFFEKNRPATFTCPPYSFGSGKSSPGA